MASGDTAARRSIFKFSLLELFPKYRVPLMGALLDYIDNSFDYFRVKSLLEVERLNWNSPSNMISANFICLVCFLLGLICNVKFGVVTSDKVPLGNDLHYVLLSSDEKLYIDDIDVSKVMWCIEASDFLTLMISCALVCNSWKMRSPLSEYLFLPWLGVTLRGLFLRQVPTAAALIYTIVIVQGAINPLFLTGFSFLFLVEARLWLEIARLVRSRWEKGDNTVLNSTHHEVHTLWNGDDEDSHSVQVKNFFY